MMEANLLRPALLGLVVARQGTVVLSPSKEVGLRLLATSMTLILLQRLVIILSLSTVGHFNRRLRTIPGLLLLLLLLLPLGLPLDLEIESF
mmetsp:Transcript_839/g.1060  ORF Transcript_839/g.1060 Transcript_839/m.1060 type:complete len:91 (-) Transcript_839:1160-1432(-)